MIRFFGVAALMGATVVSASHLHQHQHSQSSVDQFAENLLAFGEENQANYVDSYGAGANSGGYDMDQPPAP